MRPHPSAPAFLLAGPLLALASCSTTPSAPPAEAVAYGAGGPTQLFSDLGPYSRPVSTDSAEAQRYFDQALNWMYAFNHDEAVRSFTRAAELDPDELIPRVLSLSAEVARAESTSVILHDVETKQLVIAAATGRHAAEVEGLRFPEGAGIAGHVHGTGRPCIVEDAQADSSHLQEIDRATEHLTRSLMAAPLVVGEHRLGVVEAVNRVGGGSFSREDLDRFAIFANLIAVALRNARSSGVSDSTLLRTIDAPLRNQVRTALWSTTSP